MKELLLKIYIIEDMAVARMSLIQILTRKGHIVAGSAANLETAISQIGELDIDLLLIDVNLRGTKDGIWIGQHIRDNYNLPFVYLTAYSDDDTLEKIHETRPNGYLMKPYDRVTLLNTITIAYQNFIRVSGAVADDNKSKFIVINKKNSKLKIYFNDIICISAEGNYLAFKTKHNLYLERMTLKMAMETLPACTFIKTTKSQIVNVNFITALDSETILVNEVWMPISRVYRKKVIELFEKSKVK